MPPSTSSSRGAQVVINVYDLLQQNDWTYWAGIGVFHTGVEVYGVEYAFGGHDYDAPAVQALVQQMGVQYKGNRYHLLQMNCNHFSSDLCSRLTGQLAPGWINRLAAIAVSLHCLLPAGWMPQLRPPTGAQVAADERAEFDRLLNPMDHLGSSSDVLPASITA